LTLRTAIDPRDGSFSISKICIFAEKFYPADFSEQERTQLQYQLPHFQLDICNHPDLKILLSLADLTSELVKTGKAFMYPRVYRLMRLVMTLLVSTATTERAFSTMKLIKTRLRNRMGDGFLRDYMVVYIEKEIAEKFTSDEIINMYDLLGSRRAKLKLIEM
jgi:hAT family C-terminal dimerisation region